MITKYRLYGMIICLILITLGMLIGSYYPVLLETAWFLMGFAAGYGLRETVEKKKEEE